ncbi:MAG TPA: SCO family protein [Nocardioides sp.]|uniref:SCO family protein n=1 Tax=Nocardioides sp. TaxID=35761 RepID=UPI002F3F7325
MSRTLLLGLALALGSAMTACASSEADTFAGAVLHRPYHAPATELTDTDGHPFSLATSTDRRLTLVFFGYTHCPDECPTTMATLASAMLQLDESDRDSVQVVFVTTDPARDTGPVIRRWLDHFSSSFVGVTGPLATIKKVAIDVGVPVDKGRRLPSGGYDVTHGTQVLAVDGKNSVPVVWTMGTTAPEFAHDIHQLLS